MEDNKIRQEVRKVLREIGQAMKSTYPVNGDSGGFPYADQESIVRLPADIDTKDDYLVNWEAFSENDDLYNFPLEEFKKGIRVEKAKNQILNILDISKKVINNLEDNPEFYTDLGVK